MIETWKVFLIITIVLAVLVIATYIINIDKDSNALYVIMVILCLATIVNGAFGWQSYTDYKKLEFAEIQKCIDDGYTMYLNGEEIPPITIDWKNDRYDVTIDNENKIILVTG